MLSLDGAALRQHLGTSSFVGELVVLDSTGSTNDEAMRLLDSGAPEGTVVVANHQTAGRGRLGRAWHSAPGSGLYLSVVFRPEAPIESLTRWTVAAALAACEACRECARAPIEIEWPNDLVFLGRKVAGTLAELRSAGGVATGLVLGTGFNVNQSAEDFPPELRERAVSLRIARGGGEPISREGLAASYLIRLGSIAALLARGAWPEIVRGWLTLAPGARGRRVLVAPESGDAPVSGTTRGLDAHGALLVECPDGSLLRVRMSESVTSQEVE